jgi:hypothetical protein
MHVVVDLVLSKRFIYYGSLLINLAVINVLPLIHGAAKVGMAAQITITWYLLLVIHLRLGESFVPIVFLELCSCLI